MKVYIAGPIRNRPNKNKHAFASAETLLRNFGHEPVNPFSLATPEDIAMNEDRITSETCRRFCRQDVDAILKCDGIYMLMGWESSVGARAEHAVAVWCQLHIMYEVFPFVEMSFSRSTGRIRKELAEEVGQ